MKVFWSDFSIGIVSIIPKLIGCIWLILHLQNIITDIVFWSVFIPFVVLVIILDFYMFKKRKKGEQVNQESD